MCVWGGLGPCAVRKPFAMLFQKHRCATLAAGKSFLCAWGPSPLLSAFMSSFTLIQTKKDIINKFNDEEAELKNYLKRFYRHSELIILCEASVKSLHVRAHSLLKLPMATPKGCFRSVDVWPPQGFFVLTILLLSQHSKM